MDRTDSLTAQLDKLIATTNIDPTETPAVSLTQLGANFSRVYLPGGGTLWFSYETPVAAAMPGYGIAKIDGKITTVTTRKHLGTDDLTRTAVTLTPERWAAFLSVVR